MNDISKFREILAENGIEMTPEQAILTYKMAKDLVKRSKKMSMKDLWAMQDCEAEGISKEERDQIIKLYQQAKEI